MDKTLLGELINESGGVLEKVYDDVAHPTAKSVGNTISLIPRTVGVWLGKWEKWIINGEESIRRTGEAVQEKVKKIPEEKLTEPEPYVAIPAIQQLSYCYDSEELREMYANLLVSSMNQDTKSKVHPSFIDIVKQLTPDEAKLLKVIKDTSAYLPLIDLQINYGKGNGHIAILQNFTNLCDGVCENPKNVCEYIENLDRLKLICVLEDIHLMNKERYRELEDAPLVSALKLVPLQEGQTFTIKEKSFYVTSFGKAFIKVCVD